MHAHRRFCVSPVASAEELAHMLTERTWTLCSGFYVQSDMKYLFLNDCHVRGWRRRVRRDRGGSATEQHVQIESITFELVRHSIKRWHTSKTPSPAAWTPMISPVPSCSVWKRQSSINAVPLCA